jgi:UDP-glucose 4-epimerase
VLEWAGDLVDEVISATMQVRRWARSFGATLIDVSTSEVYGSGAADAEDDPCHFLARTSARKEYAVAKLAAETMLLNSRGLDVIVVRPFNVAGPGQLPDGGFVIPRFVRQALANEPMTVYQPGNQRRAFTHVADIVDGLIAAYRNGRPGAVYNLGNPGNTTTIRELAEEVRAAARSSSPIDIIDPTTLWGPDFREAADKLPRAELARRELEWVPTRDRATIIGDVLSSLRVAA